MMGTVHFSSHVTLVCSRHPPQVMFPSSDGVTGGGRGPDSRPGFTTAERRERDIGSNRCLIRCLMSEAERHKR